MDCVRTLRRRLCFPTVSERRLPDNLVAHEGVQQLAASRRLLLAASAALLLLVALTWSNVHTFEFVHWDDGDYVYGNPIVTNGVTADAMRHAFSFHAGNWHPLTWISHMIDVELFGLDAGAHHVTSLLLHALNVLALLLVLVRFTGSLGRSAFVAAVFAVHPLNVENVAWVSERKTLLSVFFTLVTLLLWHRWVTSRAKRFLAAATLAFALALMAKPYVIMLPLLLVIADFWPLRRLRWDDARSLVVEKSPLFALSLASAGLTWLAQTREGAVAASGSLPMLERVLHATVACVWYVRKTFWPSDLIFFYPHPAIAGPGVSRIAALLATVLLVTVTIVAFRFRRSAPALLFGWMWFLVGLVPVIGIVQVGQQGWADRYAYLPQLGLVIATTWIASDVAMRQRAKPFLVGAATFAVVVLAIATTRQAAHWRDSTSLFQSALRVDPTNWAAWQNVGVLALERGDLDGAMLASERSLASNPGNALAMYNVAYVWSMRSRPDLARPWYERALAIRPHDVHLMLGLSLNLLDTGDAAGALRHAQAALNQSPDSELALYATTLSSAASGDVTRADRALVRLRTVSPRLAADAAARIRGRS